MEIPGHAEFRRHLGGVRHPAGRGRHGRRAAPSGCGETDASDHVAAPARVDEPDRADPRAGAVRWHDVRGRHLLDDQEGSTTYTRNNVFSFSATVALHRDQLGPERRRHLRDHVEPEQHGQHDRVRRRQLRERLHRRPLLLGQRHGGEEHRRDQHHDRQRGHGLRVQRVWRGADHGRHARTPARRRQLHRHQRRQQRPVHGQPEPDDREERRVPAPEHLGQLPVPGREPERHPRLRLRSSATAAARFWSRATSPRSAGRPGSRRSSSTSAAAPAS